MRKSRCLMAVLLTGVSLSGIKMLAQETSKSHAPFTEKVAGFLATRYHNDPLNVYEFQLENGLRVILSPHPVAPRVYANINVHAGARHEKESATGVAHYLEHMLFKGTDQIGTINWEKEKILLDRLAELYEKLRQARTEDERKQIFREIDQVAVEASQYAIPNEYEFLYNSLGGRALNAYTTFDRTVYIGDIPANELERWLQLEAERFTRVVPRLFNVELETVYEEYNLRFQDWDFYRVLDDITGALFPDHPYSRPVIGYPEHLKYPSIRAMEEFFSTWYVPNNMSVCIAGDISPEAIQLIHKYFGQWKPSDALPPLPDDTLFVEPFDKIVEEEEISAQPEYIAIAYRVPTIRQKDLYPVMVVLDYIIFNGYAGVLDLELVQKQKVLDLSTFYHYFREGGIYVIVAEPRQGQTLEEVRDLILQAMQKVVRGEFPRSLVKSAIRNIRVDLMERWESSRGRVSILTSVYTSGLTWGEFLEMLDQMEKVTYEDVVQVARTYLGKGYVVVYKRQGSPEKLLIPKPEFSDVQPAENARSEFARQLLAFPSTELEPRFVDFHRDVQRSVLVTADKSHVPVYYAPNHYSDLFRLVLKFPYGYAHLPVWEVAFRLLEYCGTENMSPEEVRRRLFELGVTLSVDVDAEVSSITLEGLQEVMGPAVRLMMEILQKPVCTEEILQNVVADILKQRENMRQNPDALFRALVHYVVYGPVNRFTARLSSQELQELQMAEVLEAIRNILSIPHTILVSSPAPLSEITAILKPVYHPLTFVDTVVPVFQIRQRTQSPDTIFYVPYEKVQVDVLRVTLLDPYSEDFLWFVRLFNEYYGGGIGGMIFREIREKRGLAYAAGGGIQTPSYASRRFIQYTYAAGQYDKTRDIMEVMESVLFREPIYQPAAFESALRGAKKSIASRRYWGISLVRYVEHQERFMKAKEDPSRRVYAEIQNATLDKFAEVLRKRVLTRPSAYVIVADPSLLPPEKLAEWTSRPVQQVPPEKLFVQ